MSVSMLNPNELSGVLNRTDSGGDGEVVDHCSQGSLTNLFGIIIQGVLAFLAFSSLICKS